MNSSAGKQTNTTANRATKRTPKGHQFGPLLSGTQDEVNAALAAQTYQRTSAGSSSKRVQQPVQLQQHLVRTGAFPIVNAPTSLTNLAQLSGITLVPMPTRHPTQFETSQQRPTVGLSSNLDSKNILNHPMQVDFPTDARTTHGQPYNAGSNSLSGFNLPPIASIRLINLASSQHIDRGQPSPNDETFSTSGSHMQSKQARTKPNGRYNSRKTKQQSSTRPTTSRDSQSISINEGLHQLADLSDMQVQQPLGGYSDDIGSQPSLEPPMDNAPLDEEQHNLSLMKLMSILNNPAITITAVGPRDAHKSFSSNNDQQPKASYLKSPSLSISIPNHSNDRGSYYREPGFAQGQPAMVQQVQPEVSSRARVPQSAANIQVMQGGAFDFTPARGSNSSMNSRCTSVPSVTKGNTARDSSPSPAKQPPTQREWVSTNKPTELARARDKPSTSSWPAATQNSCSNPFASESTGDSKSLSTSVRNLMNHQLPSNSRPPVVSSQLLQHIVNQSKDSCRPSLPIESQGSVLEPECIISVPRSVQQFTDGAKRFECSDLVTTSSVQSKKRQHPLESSKERLFIPRVVNKRRAGSMINDPNQTLSTIHIERGEQREVYLSERHLILDSMMSGRDHREIKTGPPEPDDIFVNRSKRVMSKIDTMIERKKRKRFERISGRAEPKTSSLEEQCADSEEEWSADELDADKNTITALYPLEEHETDEKAQHLESVGLVSRSKRNKIYIDQVEKKLDIFSPLLLENHEIPEDITRLVDVMLKTGGRDIQMRVDSNIKRNELTFIEGLSRITGRMKMSYMNLLGLEKRSKRTTLYKVKPIETMISTTAHKQTDLKKVRYPMAEQHRPQMSELPRPILTSNNRLPASNMITPNKVALISCREAIKHPSKDEYMKSLGLMAS